MKNLNEQVQRIKTMMGLINEEMNQQGVQEFQNELQMAGVEPLSDEELNELQPDCPVETPSEHSDVMEQLKVAIEKISDRRSLVSLLKQVMGLKRKQASKENVQEQVEPLIIAGVTIPPIAITVALGFIALLIVIKLAKLILGVGGRNKDCERKHRLFQRFGPQGVV